MVSGKRSVATRGRGDEVTIPQEQTGGSNVGNIGADRRRRSIEMAVRRSGRNDDWGDLEGFAFNYKRRKERRLVSSFSFFFKKKRNFEFFAGRLLLTNTTLSYSFTSH